MKCAATLVWLQVKSGTEKTGTAVSLLKMKLLCVCHNGPLWKTTRRLCVKLAKVQLEMVSQVFGIFKELSQSLMWTDLIQTTLCQKTLQLLRTKY